MNRLILLTLALLAFACGGASHDAKVALFDCRVEALKPITGNVLDAADLAREVYAGRASLAAVLQAMKASEAEAHALYARLQACEPPPVMPEASDAGAL